MQKAPAVEAEWRAKQALAHVAAASLPNAAAAVGGLSDGDAAAVGHAQAGVQALEHVLHRTLPPRATVQLCFPPSGSSSSSSSSSSIYDAARSLLLCNVNLKHASEERGLKISVQQLKHKWQVFVDRWGSGVVRKLLQVPVVQQHHSIGLVPLYVHGSKQAQCSRCGQLLPQWCIGVHLCKEPVLLSLEQQEQLACAMGDLSSWDRCSCPLCKQRAGPNTLHACSSWLWKPLVMDSTALTPGLAQGDVASEARLVLRQGRLLPAVSALDMLPVRIVFPLPAVSGEYQQQQQQQLELLQKDCWPLAMTTVVSGRSHIQQLSQQQGLFFFCAPDHSTAGDISTSAVNLHTRSRTQGSRTAPLYTCSMLGYYEGIRELRVAQRQDEVGSMLYRCTLTEGISCNPSFVGSILRGANLGHGPAATVVTEEVRLPVLSQDGSSLEPGPVRVLMRTRQRSGLLEAAGGWATCQDGKKFRMGEQLQEWFWDYNAVTDDPNDPCLQQRCFCPTCTGTLKGLHDAQLPAEELEPRYLMALKQ